mgnify:CR=1 FL=1
MIFLRKKINPGINLILISINIVLLGLYVYQTIFISSGNINLVSLKKEFFEVKNSNPAIIDTFDPVFAREGMAEIKKFDYLIIGPSEFALIKESENVKQQ